MDELALRAMLFDFYGPLLTQKQQTIYDLYYQQDLSLGEIAEQQNVSRQAVFDLIKRTDDSLHEYEEKLQLIKRRNRNMELIRSIKKRINELVKESPQKNEEKVFALLEKLENNW